MVRFFVAALLLSLAASAAAVCNCSSLTTCGSCTVDYAPASPDCYGVCQWCTPKLSCQNNDAATCPTSTASKINPLIGPRHSYQCQSSSPGDSGNGPLILDAIFTAGNGSTYPLWNGSSSAAQQMTPGPALPTQPAGSAQPWSLKLNGINWGEQVTTPDARSIQLCPWLRMAQFSDHSGVANPVGPVSSSCFNCTNAFVDVHLDPQSCGYHGVDDKNQFCSSVTCQGPIPGIGADLAVFIQVRGEPRSVVALHTAKPPAGAFGGPEYARVSFEPPVVTSIQDAAGKPCTNCVTDPLQNITLLATGLPLNQAVVDAYESGVTEQGTPVGKAVTVTIGSFECNVHDLTPSQLACQVPVGSGANLPITLTVGGQSRVANANFSYSAPKVAGVVGSLASFGGSINITGDYFADPSVCPSCHVSLVPLDTALAPIPCVPTSWSQKVISCTAGPSGSSEEVPASVLVYTDSGPSNTAQTKFQKCQLDASTQGAGTCLSDGNQVCNNNFQCTHGGSTDLSHNQPCDFVDASCTCKNICENGAAFNPGSCSCTCLNGYSSSGGAQIPLSNGAVSSATCDLCAVSCGGLQKKVQTATKCGCEFNMLHLIWIVLLVVLVLAAAGFGFWKWRAAQQGKFAPLLTTDKYDEENARESEPTDSASYM